MSGSPVWGGGRRPPSRSSSRGRRPSASPMRLARSSATDGSQPTTPVRSCSTTTRRGAASRRRRDRSRPAPRNARLPADCGDAGACRGGRRHLPRARLHGPAARCDLDHDIPWPHGPTEVANLTSKHDRTTTCTPTGTGSWGATANEFDGAPRPLASTTPARRTGSRRSATSEAALSPVGQQHSLSGSPNDPPPF